MKITFLSKLGLLWLIPIAGLIAADEDLQKAHELELEAKNSERQSVISELNQSSPQEAAAHWLNGEIQVGEQWLPYHRVVDEGDRWAELHRYQEERAKKTDSVDDQLFLADGCRHHKLFDEERAHLHGVIAADPEHAEARQRLGDQKIQGVWITAEEAASARRIIEANQRAYRAYSKNLMRLVKNLSDPKRRKAALVELSEIRDPAAIPVMEELLTYGAEQQQLDYLKWLNGVSSWKASASMARLAVMSENAKVRIDASKLLETKRREEFVPTIIGSMSTPIAIRNRTQNYGDWVFFSQHFESETATKLYDFYYFARYSPEFINVNFFQPNFQPRIERNSNISSFRDGERIFASLQEQANIHAEESNKHIEVWNERCSRALSQSLDIQGMQSPQQWWAWWEDDQGYVIDSKDQVFGQYQEEWYVGRRRGPVRPPGTVSPYMPVGSFRSSSCFAAGTPVMTEFGSKPIESIVRGDRVLSQDIETGELAFKPVFRTTKRTSPGSAIVKFGDEQLTCTPCHPFWVNGQGWRMARELAPGDRFHSVTGAVDVTAVEEAGSTEVFNLDVGDFHTYFVGKNPILTHDVTVRQPTDMILPGYSRPIASAAK